MKKQLAIFLCLCLIVLSALPTEALTPDLQAAFEENTPSAEQMISPENPIERQPSMEHNEPTIPSELSAEGMTAGMEDMRRTESTDPNSNQNTSDFNIAFTDGVGDPVYKRDYEIDGDQLVIYGQKGTTENVSYTISMQSAQTVFGIRVLPYSKVTITLQSLTIDRSSTGAAIEIDSPSPPSTAQDVTIKLSGENKLISNTDNAGIKKISSDNTLTIQSATGNGTGEDGSLHTIGGNGGAGISGKNITITGGTITAKGGANAAGIGGNLGTSTSNIKIKGGNVTATGGKNGAGIGGGNGENNIGGDAENIIISGGTVTATGGANASGIGVGLGTRTTSSITIKGGTVTAKTTGSGIAIGGGTATVTVEPSATTPKITVKAGENENAASEINSSPFNNGNSENIYDKVKTAKYFHSEPGQSAPPPATQHNIILRAEPTAGGTVEGEGQYNANTNATVTATPNSGYRFVRWTESGNEVSTNATYTFSVTGARTLVAVFAQNPPPAPPAPRRYRIQLTAAPTEGGIVDGAGRYRRNREVIVTATPNSGYHFVHWTENNNPVSTESKYTFSAKKNRTLVAVFAKDIIPTLEKETNDPSHSWTISFNQALDPADITSENFYIQDADGNLLLEIRPILLENNRQVRMENTTRFESSKDYFLFIRKGVRSANEKNLAQDVIMKFRVKEK